MPECLLLLGTNLGRRRENLRRALRGLDRIPGGKVLARSRLYDTAAVGPRAPRYLNMAVRYRTALSPSHAPTSKITSFSPRPNIRSSIRS